MSIASEYPSGRWYGLSNGSVRRKFVDLIVEEVLQFTQ